MKNQIKGLDELELLIGEWKMESIVNDVVVVSGKTTFAWLAGKSYLIQHTAADPPLPTTPQIWIDNSPFPTIAIISLDDHSGQLYYNYADGRDVHRVYQMSFKDKTMELRGQVGPKFYQRLTNTLSEDGNTINSLIEKSEDNKTWQTDFIARYTRLKSAPG